MKTAQTFKFEELHNYYTVKVIDADTMQTVQEVTAKNIVLDQFYHHLASNGGSGPASRQLHFGSGTGSVSASRTSLFDQTGERELSNFQATYTDDLVTFTGKVTLTENEYVGTYIREVGLSIRTAYNWPTHTLLSHALLEDSEGNPISIGPKTNTQIIELYATLYLQRAAGMLPFPNNLSRIFTDSYAPGIYAPTVQPQGIALGGGTYDLTTKTWTSAKKRIATGDGNNHGVMTHIVGGAVSEPIMLNDPDIFPVYTFLERSVGSGDGVKKGIILTPGLVKPGTESIKVAGELQVRDVDYKFFTAGRNVQRSNSLNLPYGGCNPDVYATNSSKEKLDFLGKLSHSSALPGGDRMSFILDLGGLDLINRMSFTPGAGYNGYGMSINICFSENLETWTPPESASMGYGVWSSEYNDIENTDAYRYIWISASYNLPGVTIYGAHNIVFTTPPANGAAITAKWDVDVPPKDDKLFYDVQVAYTATW